MLAVLVVAAYPEVLLGRGTFFHRDFSLFGYPLAHYHRESFWQGEIPLWNPLSYCGLPFLAQWNTLTLYPLSAIYLLLPLSWSLGVFCLLHFYLAGMGMYFLAYRWTDNRFAAAAAGVAFSFNALMLNCLMWPNNIAAMGWLPWVVLATERAWRNGGRWLPVAALAGAMQLFAGAPEVIFLTWVLVAALFAGAVVGAPGGRWRMSARFLTAGFWVAGLAAAQLLPFLDLLAHSQRGKAFADSLWSMPAWGLANYLVPLYRSYSLSLGTYAQPDQYWILSYYLGVGVVALALLAIGLVRRRLVWLLSALTVVCLLLAHGDHALLYSAFRKVVPGLGFMRYPVKFVILPTVLIPLLAAVFLTRCLTVTPDEWPRLRRYLLGLGLGLLAIIGIVVWSAYQYPLRDTSALVAATSGASSAGFLIMILGVIVALRQTNRQPLEIPVRLALIMLLWLDTLTAMPRPNPSAPRWVYEPNLARKELRPNPAPETGRARVMLTAKGENKMYYLQMTNASEQVVYARLALHANANLLDRIPKVLGFYSLFPQQLGEIKSTLLAGPQPPARLADFLAVSHINMPGRVIEWEFRPTHLSWVTAGQEPVFTNAAATLKALTSPDFDPRRTVFLPPTARALVTVSNSSPAHITVQEFSAHRVKLETEAAEPALVVIAQSFYHNWRAYVAGRPAPLWRANHAFQALQVPAGRQEVILAYEDRAFYCGAVISLISAVAAVGIWLRGRKRLAS